MSVSFHSLAPDAALAAAEAAGLRPTGHVSPLTCLENRVFDLRLESGAHAVLKFYRPGRWSRGAIEAEHAFLAELDAAEVPVCAPLALATGETLGTHEGLLFAVWPRTGGRSPDELHEPALARLGRLLARIHGVGARHGAPERGRLDAASRIDAPLACLEAGGFLPPSCAARYAAAARALGSLYTARSEGVPLQRIHGDCHRGNLLCDGERWFFLDFDDHLEGPVAYDVFMLLPGRDAAARQQRALLIEAYRSFRPFDDAWLELIEPLRGLRFVWYAGWIARRWDDPVFRDAFPHFGSEDYWLRETEDLEQQLAIAHGEAAAHEPGDAPLAAGAEPELSNADFFWDME